MCSLAEGLPQAVLALKRLATMEGQKKQTGILSLLWGATLGMARVSKERSVQVHTTIYSTTLQHNAAHRSLGGRCHGQASVRERVEEKVNRGQAGQ